MGNAVYYTCRRKHSVTYTITALKGNPRDLFGVADGEDSGGSEAGDAEHSVYELPAAGPRRQLAILTNPLYDHQSDRATAGVEEGDDKLTTAPAPEATTESAALKDEKAADAGAAAAAAAAADCLDRVREEAKLAFSRGPTNVELPPPVQL